MTLRFTFTFTFEREILHSLLHYMCLEELMLGRDRTCFNIVFTEIRMSYRPRMT